MWRPCCKASTCTESECAVYYSAFSRPSAQDCRVTTVKLLLGGMKGPQEREREPSQHGSPWVVSIQLSPKRSVVGCAVSFVSSDPSKRPGLTMVLLLEQMLRNHIIKQVEERGSSSSTSLSQLPQLLDELDRFLFWWSSEPGWWLLGICVAVIISLSENLT